MKSLAGLSAIVLRFLLIFTLAVFGPAAILAHGQSQSAPVAQPADGKVSADLARAGESSPPKNDNDVYRHTPFVQAVARMSHLDVETTARLFEYLNFAIVALAIVIPLARFMPKLFRQRSQTLKHDLETARKTTADANARLSAVEAKLSKLDSEIAAIRTQVEQEIKHDEARIKASIGEESSRIVAAAEQEIAAAAAQARRGLRHFAADLAIDQAAKQLVLTPETDRALISEFVGDAAKGRQN